MAKLTKRSENYSQWYNELVVQADLAEQSAVRGCMVIKPYGYSIWEKMHDILDKMFKETGHTNAYFPLFIPKSFFSREADHVEGFAKECAVVTHYRLRTNADKTAVEVDPEAKLEEELIVRPTSETIIWNTYRNWVKLTSGQMLSVGKCVPVYSFVLPNSCGRKVIPHMLPRKRLWKKPTRWFMYMPILLRIILVFR